MIHCICEVLPDLLALIRVLKSRQLLRHNLDDLAQHLQRDGLAPSLIEQDIMVQNLHKELNLYKRIHALLGNLETLLQTVVDLLGVLGWLPGSCLVRSRPEEMTDRQHAPALVWLLEQLGGGQSALGAKGVVILI